MIWAPNVPTEEEIEGFVEDLMAVTPEILGIDETLPGCEVINMDPYGVGTLPRYIKVAIREYYQDVFYRGGLAGLLAGDHVTVTHLREGNRYEVTGAGGSSGTVPSVPNPTLQGQALVSNAVPEWVASLAPTWLGTHTWGSGFDLMPTDAAGQDLGDATHRWDLYTQEVYFGGATGANVITVPDNVADALHISDAGGLEYLRIVSTNANPYFLIDPAGAGIDVGIATATPEGKLDVAYGGFAGRMTLLLGADIAASTRTPNANQKVLIGAHHSLAGEEPLGMMRAFSSTVVSALRIGGGDGNFNAATKVSIYTAANITTTTGTERFLIDSAGAITVTGPSLTVPAAWNLIVPDNVADALGLEDVGGLEYLRIVSTNAQPATTFNSGGVDVDFTVQAVGVADALVVRGNDGQITLGILTVGYVKSSAGGVLSVATEVALADLAGYAQGRIIRGGAADWEALAHPGAAGYALISDATDVVWDQTPLWSGVHTHAADIILDDGVGDSPQLQFIGGSNNDTVLMYLDDNAVANDSDLMIRLCAADTGSRLIIQDNSPATVAYIDADGDADFAGHLAVGGMASISVTRIVNVKEATVLNAGTFIGQEVAVAFSPTANFNTSTYGLYFTVNLTTAHSRTGGGTYGLFGQVVVDNGVDARDLNLVGGQVAVDVEDAGSGGGWGATVGSGLDAYTPFVDTGSCLLGYGVRILQGTVGAGSVWTLYGLNIADINAGTINYAIYTGTGLVHFGDQVEIIGSAAADIQLLVRGAAAQSGDLQEWQSSAPAILSRINKDGYIMTRKVAAPADGDVATSELALWFDNTNGNAFAMFKGKTADGTVVTGSVALA